MIPACQSAPAGELPFFMPGNHHGLSSLGQSGSVQQLVISAPSIAGGIVTGVATAGTGTAAGAAGIWGMTAAVAVPVIGAAVAGITIALMLIFSRKGPKQKVATTKIVDAVEPILRQNVAAYLAGPRTVSSQAQAVENFKAGWQYVVDNCNIPEMGDPGQACIRDRSPGGQWDWWAYYYDPIANDSSVRPDSDVISQLESGASSLLPSELGGTGSSFAPLLAVGLLLWGLLA